MSVNHSCATDYDSNLLYLVWYSDRWNLIGFPMNLNNPTDYRCVTANTTQIVHHHSALIQLPSVGLSLNFNLKLLSNFPILVAENVTNT